MAKPPYQQIAEEIRQRIAAGELKPGARVPSARQITAKWGVAIATATKVLALLQQEGSVKVVPGVGTVVAGLPATLPSSKSDSEGLSRTRIVAAAMEIADTEGMAALSMRRIATELAVATMSLYRHVRGKEELLLHMIDVAFGEAKLPAKRPAGWRPQLEVAAQMLWALFRRHRWLAPVMSLTRPQLAPNALKYTDWVLTALSGHGLAPITMLHAHVTLFSHIRGLAASLESEAEAEQDTGITSDEWIQSQEATMMTVLGEAQFSGIVRDLMQSDVELDLDTMFSFGLERMLDGFAVLIAAQGSAAKGARSRQAGSTR